MTQARLGPDDLIRRAINQRGQRQNGSARVSAAVVLLVVAVGGVLLILFGVSQSKDDSAPSCDGKTMQQGDQCVGINTSSYDYQQGIDNRHNRSQMWEAIGVIAVGVDAVVAIPIISNLNPTRPWGTAVRMPCPRCGRPSLQEKNVSASTSRGRTIYSVSGIATVCTPECGYGTVRRAAR